MAAPMRTSPPTAPPTAPPMTAALDLLEEVPPLAATGEDVVEGWEKGILEPGCWVNAGVGVVAEPNRVPRVLAAAENIVVGAAAPSKVAVNR